MELSAYWTLVRSEPVDLVLTDEQEMFHSATRKFLKRGSWLRRALRFTRMPSAM
jgi:hypothetical protein